MGFFDKYFSGKTAAPAVQQPTTLEGLLQLAAASKDPKAKRFLEYAAKSISRVRQDIKSWNDALASAQTEEPKNYALQLLFSEIMLDALLTSQIENRKQQVFSSEFSLLNESGEIDEEQTAILRRLPAYRRLSDAGLDGLYYGYNLVELSLVQRENGTMHVEVTVIPRTNVVPQLGRFYPDYIEDKNILYREMPEFGTWILEYNSGTLGLLNKAVVHVLFKRFAQSCWSELCEIYGIPPRVLTTNTQDANMLNRAQKMMQDMGTAAWFIIDETEKFEWAQGVATNGDVYNNLIKLCSNEISLLISGAIIGQDTVNGNRSKEESSQDMLWQLVQSDMAMLEEQWNNINLPALVKLGIIKPGLRFEFNPTEDVDQLWEFTKGALQYYKIDPEWMKKTFRIEITGERESIAGAGKQDNSKEIAKQMLCAIFD